MSATKIVYLSDKIYHSRLPKFIREGVAQFLKNVNRLIFSCDISFDSSIGNNLKLPHQGLRVIIGPKIKIGNNVKIYPNVTLGAKLNNEKYSYPIIGDNVIIGTGARILGNVRIGNNVKIGANSVVLTDIPDNCLAVGVPARIIRKEEII